MMAREGANVTIVHLPEELTDARDVKKQIEDESGGKQKCLTLPLDLMQEENCKKAIEGKRFHFKVKRVSYLTRCETEQNT
jgi:NAD(P)-dependent dehydrogenase (short-subunit alcohol dehydrogenase family)